MIFIEVYYMRLGERFAATKLGKYIYFLKNIGITVEKSLDYALVCPFKGLPNCNVKYG